MFRCVSEPCAGVGFTLSMKYYTIFNEDVYLSQPAWCDNKCELNNVLLLMLSGKVNLLWVAGPVVYRWLLR